MHALIDALGISRLEDVKWVVNREVKDEKGRVERGLKGDVGSNTTGLRRRGGVG